MGPYFPTLFHHEGWSVKRKQHFCAIFCKNSIRPKFHFTAGNKFLKPVFSRIGPGTRSLRRWTGRCPPRLLLRQFLHSHSSTSRLARSCTSSSSARCTLCAQCWGVGRGGWGSSRRTFFKKNFKKNLLFDGKESEARLKTKPLQLTSLSGDQCIPAKQQNNSSSSNIPTTTSSNNKSSSSSSNNNN